MKKSIRIQEEAMKILVESLKPLQENPDPNPKPFRCPRCGHKRMKPEAIMNSLSRYADVYICNKCGMDEAVRDMAEQPPLPFASWSMTQALHIVKN